MHVPVRFGTRQSIDYAASSLAWLSDAGSVIHAKNGGGRGCFTLDAKPLSSGDVLHVELEMQMHGNPRQGGPGGSCRVGVVPATDLGLTIDGPVISAGAKFWGLQLNGTVISGGHHMPNGWRLRPAGTLRFIMELDTRVGQLKFIADGKESIIIDDVCDPVVALVITVHADVAILNGGVAFAEVSSGTDNEALAHVGKSKRNPRM